MAFTRVQAPKVAEGSGASWNISYNSLPGIGNLIIIAITASFAGGSGPCSSISDNQTGNTYTEVPPTGGAGPDANDSVQIFYCVVVGSSGTFTVTAHFPGVSEGSTMAIHEYSGNAVSPFDKTANNTGSSAAPALGSNITPNNANSLVFSAEVDGNADATSITAGTNFTIQATQLTSSTLERIGTEHWIQTAATATTAGFSLGGSAPWALMVAVFKPPLGNFFQFFQR
jgi:hypothetical protein